MESDVWFFVEENDVTEFSPIVEHFGKPEDVIDSFLTENGMIEINRSIQARRRFAIAAFAIIFLSALFFIGARIADYILNEKYRNGHAVEAVYAFEMDDNNWPEADSASEVRSY